MSRREYDSIYESAELRSTAKIERKPVESNNLLQTDPIYYTSNKINLFKRSKNKLNKNDLEDFFDLDIHKASPLTDIPIIRKQPEPLHISHRKSINEEYDWLNDLIKIPEPDNDEYENQRFSSPVAHVLTDTYGKNLSNAVSGRQIQVINNSMFDKHREEELLESLDDVIYDLERQRAANKRRSIQSIDKVSDKQKYDALEQHFDPFLSDIQVNTNNDNNIEHDLVDSRYTNKTEERRKIIQLFESKYVSNSVKAEPAYNHIVNNETIEQERELSQQKYNLTTISPLEGQLTEKGKEPSTNSLSHINEVLKMEAKTLQQELMELNHYQKQINNEIFQYQCKNDLLVSRLAMMFNSNTSDVSPDNKRNSKHSFSDSMWNVRPLTPNSAFLNKQSYGKFFESQIDSPIPAKQNLGIPRKTQATRKETIIQPTIESKALLSPHPFKNEKTAHFGFKVPVTIISPSHDEDLLFDETVDNQNLIDSLKNLDRPSLNYHTFANKNPKTANTLKSKHADDRDKYISPKQYNYVDVIDDDIVATGKLGGADKLTSDDRDQIINSENEHDEKKELSTKFNQLTHVLLNNNGIPAALEKNIEENQILSDVSKQNQLKRHDNKLGMVIRFAVL